MKTMKPTNRVEPLNTSPRDLTSYGIMIISTQLEIIRRVEVAPLEERSVLESARPRKDQISRPRRKSTKLSCCITCLFITAGLLAVLMVTIGLLIVLGKINISKKRNIERYDLGNLQYGVNKINQPSNTYLSNLNKILVQKYLSEQLRNEPGYRNLVIDEVFVENKRRQRDTSCPMTFIIQNIHVYFDHCLNCINQRNILLQRLFFNITSFRQPIDLLHNNQHVFVQVCSIPNTSNFIIPVRLDNKHELISSTTSSTLKTSSMTTHTSVSTIFYSDLLDATTNMQIEQSTSFTTDSLSTVTSFDTFQTQEETSTMSLIDIQSSTYTSTSTKPTRRRTKTSLRTTATSNSFEFLPFRPSIARFSNNSSIPRKTNTTRHDTSTKT